MADNPNDEETRIVLRNALEKINFMKFLFDLVSYCLRIFQLKWEKSTHLDYTMLIFRDDIGDAILRFRNAHDEYFLAGIQSGLPLQDIQGYVTKYVEIHFKKFDARHQAMQLFEFCAFLVDLAVYCCRCDRPDLVEKALGASAQVHEDYMLLSDITAVWVVFMLIVKDQGGKFDPRWGDGSPLPLITITHIETGYENSVEELMRSMEKVSLNESSTPEEK